ncbi:MAG TPA: GNAT family N-acetyltransferase [Acidimicrobiales bacterium]|nr:GNAT family N-acetyltransferase [Acidimicrobiales bacterium]
MPVEAARPATDADLDALRALFAAAAADLAEARGADVYFAREAPVPSREELRKSLDALDSCVLVGTLDDQIVGGGVASTEPLRDGRILGVIRVLHVDRDAREVGVGEELLRGLVAWCASRGAVAVDSLALPGERATKNFYEAAGFKARLLTVHHRLDERDPHD